MDCESNAAATASSISKEFKDQLMHALLQAEPPILKVLLEAVSIQYLVSIKL